MFRLLTSFCRSGNLGEVSVENDPQQEHFIYEFLKIEHVQEKADFLLSNMAFFFVPAGVSIINYFDELKSTAVQLIIICIISTVVTFAVTAYSVMLTVRLMKKWKDRRKKA